MIGNAANLTIGSGATFQSTASFSSSRLVTLSGGNDTFDVFPATIQTRTGVISGAGSLVKISLKDLQEFDNEFRAKLDLGLQEADKNKDQFKQQTAQK